MNQIEWDYQNIHTPLSAPNFQPVGTPLSKVTERSEQQRETDAPMQQLNWTIITIQ